MRRRQWRGRAAPSPSARGSFTDSFADNNSIHIYRIDGGSNCRLPIET
jgi:hypothetical protein